LSILTCKEIWTGRTGSIGDDLRRTYTRRFRVETTDKTWGPALVCLQNPALPAIWSAYVSYGTGEFDSFALLRRYTPRQDDADPCLWEVDCEYDTEGREPVLVGPDGTAIANASTPGRPGSGGGFDSFEQTPWEVSWETREYEMPFTMAYSEAVVDQEEPDALQRTEPVVNVVGDRYDPMPTYRTGEDILTVTRIELGNDPKLNRKYRYALNKDPFLHAARGEAQMLPIRAQLITKGRQRLWQKTYRIAFKEPELLRGDRVPNRQWQPRLLERGYNQFPYNPSTNELDPTKDPVPITDGHGQKVTEPKLLTKTGRRLAPNEVTAGTLVANTTFYAYRYLPFAVWKLDNQ
jgi:hypothetical protein